MSDTPTTWTLARLADCSDPDTVTSPGALWLASVADSATDLAGLDPDDRTDAIHELADNAVPIYTREVWSVFVDLGAYQTDTSDLGPPLVDMEDQAKLALYVIAETLLHALVADLEDEDEDEAVTS
ncbi:MAG TPA: hypothetical protein VMZ51_08255 [Acidimicrobiales bacterium]|nr:hypothetical protein [Acidimicrobiales bacterium]